MYNRPYQVDLCIVDRWEGNYARPEHNRLFIRSGSCAHYAKSIESGWGANGICIPWTSEYGRCSQLRKFPIAFTFCDVLHTIMGMKCIVFHSLELHQKGYSCITRNSIEPGLEDATIDIEWVSRTVMRDKCMLTENWFRNNVRVMPAN